MNKFMTFALVLFAAVAACHAGAASVYGAGPAVQQVSLSSLSGLGGNIAQYLGGGGSAGYAASPPHPYASSGYAAAPSASYAPAKYVVVPSPPSHSYSSSSSQSAGYGAQPSPYAGGSHSGYGAGPKLTVQPAYATQLYPGKINYKSYQSPPQFSTIALPVVPSSPVAKLYVPQGGYGASPSSAYSHGAPY